MNGSSESSPTAIVEEVAKRFAAEGRLSADDKRSLVEHDAHFLVLAEARDDGAMHAPCPWVAIARRMDDPTDATAIDVATLTDVERLYLRLLSEEDISSTLVMTAPMEMRAAVELFALPTGTPIDDGILTAALDALRPGQMRIVVTSLTLRSIPERLSFASISRISADLIQLNRRHQTLLEIWNDITLAETRASMPTINSIIQSFNSDRVVRSMRLSRLVDVLDRQLTVIDSLPASTALDAQTLEMLDQSVRDIAASLYEGGS